MRRARWLILAAICIIVFTVGSSYYSGVARMRKDAPPPPTPLRSGIDATAEGWHYRKSDDKNRGANGEPCPAMDVTAKSFVQVQQPSSYELDGVGLKLYHQCGTTYDEVKSAKASFDIASGILYSEGEAEIIRGLDASEPASNSVVKIIASGMHFETKTGKAYTDKPASFTFAHGSGKATGADYDPNNRQLHMKSQIELNLVGADPDSTPMKVETADLVYFEREGKVALTPWAKMQRGTLNMEGGSSYITLEDGDVRVIESQNAHGVQEEDGRKTEYAGEHLTLLFNDDRLVNKITADTNARISSTSETGRTDVKSDHVELLMNTEEGDSILEKALALGHAVIESTPAAKGKEPPSETRVLKSESIELKMRDGGREIDNVETHSPGSLEFIPHRPGFPHRFLNGEKFWIAYGDDNQIQNFRSIKVTTRTENPPKDGKPTPPVLTSSEEFKADFDPKTNQVARLEQTSKFRYQQGERTAQSDIALLDQKTDNITLTGSARMADPTGSSSADRIVMNQKSGDFIADGHVSSTRLPDKKGKSSSVMLSDAEPTQAKANKMVSTDNNFHIHYEGNAVAWQGANRVQADQLDLDRENDVMHATGSVVSQFLDKGKKDKDGKPVPQAQKVFTIVKAPEMVYTEDDKLAEYKGGAVMIRPNMTVKAREIRAYLKDAQSDSSLDHAFADGSVIVVQVRPNRTRTGTSEHTEYYAGEEKMIMTGGQPQFVDSLKGTTRGKILTYFTNDDRLLVNGVETQRVESLIHRK